LKDKIENVVRVGSEKSINVAVKDISLDALIQAKLDASDINKDDKAQKVLALKAQLNSVKSLRQEKENEYDRVRDNTEKSLALDDEIRKLKQQRTSLAQQLSKVQDQVKDQSRTMDSMRRRFRTEVLQEADVICSTLAGAGHDILEQFDSFEMVVIDEAAQAIELSTLIPLKYKCKRCVMVGGLSIAY
jgi:senataxin